MRGTVAVPEEPLDWIDRSIADIDADSVIRIALEPAAGVAVVALREAEKEGLRVQTVPEGHRVADQRRVDAIAGALQVLDFSEARKATAPPPDATPAGIATITTRDGLTLRLDLLTAGDGVWAGVGAVADPIAGTTPADGEGAVARAATIGRRTDGWLYRLPAYAAELLTTTLEGLIEPLPADGT